MKPVLEFKLGQHLTITPQLQQAIRLLQLSSLELHQEIQEALETNPLLEEEEIISQDSNNDESEPRESSAETELEATDADAIQLFDKEYAEAVRAGKPDDEADENEPQIRSPVRKSVLEMHHNPQIVFGLL